nr:hypothetical protein CFP56_36422 [Quercus suber]
MTGCSVVSRDWSPGPCANMLQLTPGPTPWFLIVLWRSVLQNASYGSTLPLQDVRGHGTSFLFWKQSRHFDSRLGPSPGSCTSHWAEATVLFLLCYVSPGHVCRPPHDVDMIMGRIRVWSPPPVKRHERVHGCTVHRLNPRRLETCYIVTHAQTAPTPLLTAVRTLLGGSSTYEPWEMVC